MIDANKIFDLFSEGSDIKNRLLEDLIEDPLTKIGMFVKLIQNHEIFYRKLSQFLSKDNPDYDVEQTKTSSSFAVYNRAWFYIKQIDLKNKDHLEAILKFKSEPLLDTLSKALQYFENTEQYIICAQLLTIINLKKNI
jgi:hypothetical protein